MIRLPRWIIPALAILLLIAIAAAGNSSRPASAAPQAATKEPTRQATPAQPKPSATAVPLLPTFTTVPQEAATPDASADQGPMVVGQAPSPDVGTLGIVLDRTQSNATIESVIPGGPADKAGIQAGDVVTAIDGKAISDFDSLIAVVTAKKTGDEITLAVDRGGKSQDIPVTIASRREVYCPLPAPTVTAGASLITGNPRWSLETIGTSGVKLSLSGSKMTFKPTNPGQRWQGAASIRLNNPTPADYVFTVDITQTDQTVSGLLLNYDASKGSTYLLQFQFNGSWFIRAFNSDGTVSAGPSFAESSWKVPDTSTPGASATNTVSVTVQENNWYLSINGTFVCGLPLSQIGDPPLNAGQFGVLALVDKDPSGKLGTSFSKVTLHTIAGATSAATPAATAAQ